jgi:hypothetical protein
MPAVLKIHQTGLASAIGHTTAQGWKVAVLVDISFLRLAEAVADALQLLLGLILYPLLVLIFRLSSEYPNNVAASID